MIENIDMFISLMVMIVIFIGAIVVFYNVAKRYKKNTEEDDAYYRDLL